MSDWDTPAPSGGDTWGAATSGDGDGGMNGAFGGDATRDTDRGASGDAGEGHGGGACYNCGETGQVPSQT